MEFVRFVPCGVGPARFTFGEQVLWAGEIFTRVMYPQKKFRADPFRMTDAPGWFILCSAPGQRRGLLSMTNPNSQELKCALLHLWLEHK